MTPYEKVVEKIKKLLRMTVENGASPTEAAKAAAEASRLMLEHRIDRAKLGEVFEPDYVFLKLRSPGRYGFVEAVSLLVNLSRLFGVVAFKSAGGSWAVEVAGRKETTVLVSEVWNMLLESREAQYKAYKARRPGGVSVKVSFTKGFHVGASLALIEAAEARLTLVGPVGSAIIAADASGVRAWIEEEYSKAGVEVKDYKPTKRYVEEMARPNGDRAAWVSGVRSGHSVGGSVKERGS